MARNKYPEETKKLIIDTATRLFIEKGYEHTSIQDIIEHLGGLSKGAIYHHFKSKEEIMLAVVEKMYSGSQEQLKEICNRPDLNGKEKLRLVFQKSINNPAQTEMFTLAPDIIKNPQLLVIYLQNTIQKEAPAFIQPILEEGIKDGSIQIEHPKELAEVLVLISDMWLNPLIYHCEAEELIHKVKFFQYMLHLFGLDIIDDKIFETLQKYFILYQENKIK